VAVSFWYYEFMSFEIYVSEKISLRLRGEDDAQAFFEIIDRNREEFTKWFPWAETTQSSEDTKKFIVQCREEFETKKAADFGVWYEDRWVGSMGFHTITTEHKWAEIGYWLDGRYVGKGIMTECVKAVVNYGFNDLKLHRIQIKCDSINLKSKSIPERLAFKLEGVIREDRKHGDVFSDGLIYGLLKSEWEK